MSPKIDVFAQRALFRMLSGDQNAAGTARSMVFAVKTGVLGGIYKEDQKVPALRARKMGLGWWQLIPKGEDAICLKGPSGSFPLIVFRDKIRSDPSRLDAALRKAWTTCGIVLSDTSTYKKTIVGGGTPTGPSIAPTSAWGTDLLTIILSSDRNDCLGTADPSGISRYSDCGSPVRPPFCLSAHVPFAVSFYVDRASRPRPQPFQPPTVSVRFEFMTRGGRRTHFVNRTDIAPRYIAPNEPLEPNFGHQFPVGSTQSGILTIFLELRDTSGVNVSYTDRIEYIVVPCA